MPDNQISELEVLARWKSLVGDDSPNSWAEPEDLGAFFQAFRPHGNGLSAVFKGIVGGDEILPRLIQVFEATADASENDGYFVVRKPRPLPARRAKSLGAECLEKVVEIADELATKRSNESVAELQALLRPLPDIEVVQGEAPPVPAGDTPEGLVYEVTNDFMHHLKWDRQPVESHAQLLDEALYNLACDYDLAHHILWPLYRHLTPIAEPFAAYFELWKHGAAYRFNGDDEVTIYVPNLVP